jgi:hypothetical protein
MMQKTKITFTVKYTKEVEAYVQKQEVHGNGMIKTTCLEEVVSYNDEVMEAIVIPAGEIEGCTYVEDSFEVIAMEVAGAWENN